MASEIDAEVWNERVHRYLVTLETVKRYVELLLKESISSLIDFQLSLCNGVYMARLASVLRPSNRRVVDRTQAIYRKRGLHLAHLHNIDVFLQMLKKKHFPATLTPAPADIFEQKNIPRIIYCLRALMDSNAINAMTVPSKDHKFSDEIIDVVSGSLQHCCGSAEDAYKILDMVQSEYIRYKSTIFKKFSGIKVNIISNIKQALETNNFKLFAASFKNLPHPYIVHNDIAYNYYYSELKEKVPYSFENLYDIIKRVVVVRKHAVKDRYVTESAFMALVRNYFERVNVDPKLRKFHLIHNVKLYIEVLDRLLLGRAGDDVPEEDVLTAVSLVHDIFPFKGVTQVTAIEEHWRKNFVSEQGSYFPVYNRIVKMQGVFRGALVRLRMRQFRENPTFPAVKMFTRVIPFSLASYDNEAYLLGMKGCMNTELEHGIAIKTELEKRDIQIRLLLQNKLGVQKIKKGKPEHQRFESPPAKALSGKNRMTLNAIEQLLFELKTNRDYLCQVLFCINRPKEKQILQNLTLLIHSYGLAPREEYYILKLFHMVVYNEIICMTSIADFEERKSEALNIIFAYMKQPAKMESFREAIGPTVQKILRDDPYHIIPLDIFEHLRSQVQLNYQPQTQEDAMKIELVRVRLAINIKKIQMYIVEIINGLIIKRSKLSHSIRFLFAVFYKALRKKFNADPHVVMKVITKCFFSYILNPVLVAPELHGILESPETVQITLVQRKNLSIIGKILQNTAAGVGFVEDFLSPLTEFINKNCSAMINTVANIANVGSLDQDFFIAEGIGEGLFLHPDISLSVRMLHDLALYLNCYVPFEKHEGFSSVLDRLGKYRSPKELLLGEPLFYALGIKTVDQPYKFSCVNHHTRPAILIGDDKLKDLFQRTKELCIYLLPYLNSPTLEAALSVEATPEQIEDFKLDTFLKREGITNLTHAKRRLKAMLNSLEKEGYVSKENGYRALLKGICEEVIRRTKFRQAQQLELEKTSYMRDVVSRVTNDLRQQLELFDNCLDYCAGYCTGRQSRLDMFQQ